MTAVSSPYDDYERGPLSGKLQTWYGCGPDEAITYTLAISPESRECVVALSARIREEVDREAIEHLVDTFEVDCGLVTSGPLPVPPTSASASATASAEATSAPPEDTSVPPDTSSAPDAAQDLDCSDFASSGRSAGGPRAGPERPTRARRGRGRRSLRVELPRQRVCAAIARNLHPDTRSIRYARAVQRSALLGPGPRLR
jgi:hypothetical protein